MPTAAGGAHPFSLGIDGFHLTDGVGNIHGWIFSCVCVQNSLGRRAHDNITGGRRWKRGADAPREKGC
jgi:hypothetical protein